MKGLKLKDDEMTCLAKLNAKILKNNICLSDFYSSLIFINISGFSSAIIPATSKFEAQWVNGVEWSGAYGDLSRILDSNDFFQRLNSLPLTKILSWIYAYMRLLYPH